MPTNNESQHTLQLSSTRLPIPALGESISGPLGGTQQCWCYSVPVHSPQAGIREEYDGKCSENAVLSQSHCTALLQQLWSKLDHDSFMRPGGYADYRVQLDSIIQTYRAMPAKGVQVLFTSVFQLKSQKQLIYRINTITYSTVTLSLLNKQCIHAPFGKDQYYSVIHSWVCACMRVSVTHPQQTVV